MTDQPRELAQIVNENQRPMFANINPKFQVKDDEGQVVDQIQAVVLPENMEIHSVKDLIDEYADKPDRIKDNAILDRVDSFVDYTNRFKQTASAVFARGKISGSSVEANMLAVFDYHPEGGDTTKAAFSDHTAAYKFPVSKEFRKWIRQDGEPMSQADFAHFIEDRLQDMSAPTDSDNELIGNGIDARFADPIQMLELARGLEVRNNEAVKQKYNTSTGETEIQYTAEHADAESKPLKVPNFFILNIPVFEMGEYYRIAVRLRYRVTSGSVKFWFDLYRVEQVFDAAFDLVCEQVKEKTELPLFIGCNDSNF